MLLVLLYDGGLSRRRNLTHDALMNPERPGANSFTDQIIFFLYKRGH